MTKNLKLSYILTLIFAAVVVAWSTLSSFFTGVGINFLVLLGIFCVLLFTILTDKHVLARIKDVFIMLSVLLALEFIVFLVFEFGMVSVPANVELYEVMGVSSKTLATFKGFCIFQNVISVFGILVFAWTLFRFLTDNQNIKISFVEAMLGNNKAEKKERKSKELSNGSLEEKPNKVQTEDVVEEHSEE